MINLKNLMNLINYFRMEKDKIIVYILIGGVVLGLLGLVYFLSFTAEERKVAAPTVSVLDVKPDAPPSESELYFPTPEGRVTVHNFFKDSTVDVSESKVSLLSSGKVAVTYYPHSGVFDVTISALDYEEFVSLRSEFEARFLSVLGISKADACKLDVKINTLTSNDERISNQEFPLSFCN